MSSLDLLIIVLLGLIIFASGLAFSRRSRTVRSFFAAGGAVPWPVSGLSLFMGFFSAATFVVWGSIAYAHGWVAVAIQWSMCAAGIVVALWVAPAWHATGTLTAAEYITRRLGPRVQRCYTGLFLLLSFFTTGASLYPAGKILSLSAGLSLTASILLICGASILYVALGGLWAVVVTDVLQLIVLTAAVVIAVPLSLERVGGMAAFAQAVPDDFFSFTGGEYTLWFIIAFGLYNLCSLAGGWSFVQRYTCVGSCRDARRVGTLFSALYFVCPVLWMLPAMLYRAIAPDPAAADAQGAFLLMCREVLPAGLLGLMISGIIFATASSLNAALNISSGILTNDLYKRRFPQSGQRRLLVVAMLSTLLFGVIAILVALTVPRMGGIVNVVINIAALTGTPLYAPVVWSLFSTRLTGRAALFTTVFAIGVNLCLKFVVPPLCGFALDRAAEMTVGVAVPLLCLAAFEWLTRHRAPGDHASADRSAVREAAAAPTEEQAAANRFGMSVIACCAGLCGAIILSLGFVAGHGAGYVFATGGALLLAAGVLWRRRG